MTCRYFDEQHAINRYDDCTSHIYSYVVENKLLIKTYTAGTKTPINYCQMCGRNLNDKGWQVSNYQNENWGI